MKPAPSPDLPAKTNPIIVFSKPFQSLSAEDSAALVEEVGFDGIECPVRGDGQIVPERVEEDLPRLVEAFRKRKLVIPVIVSEISTIGQPNAERVLRAAAKAGVKTVRLGIFKYAPDRTIARQVDEFGRVLKEIGEACGELGIQAALQNHSGVDRFGAPVWDFVTAHRDHHVANVGMCFDIGHAIVEGGLSWPIQARLAEPYYAAVYVKDYFWKNGPNGWRPSSAPLGDGMVDRSFITGLRRSGYSGVICQHHEYPLGGREEMVGHMRRDLRVLQAWLA